MLCEMEPELSLTARRMLENQPITTAFMGNKHAINILQVFQTISAFNLHVITREKEIGVLEHYLTIMLESEQTIELMRKTG